MRRPPLDSGLETGQRDLLAAIEQLAAQHPGFLHALSPCLKALLEERVLTEAAVLAWGAQRDTRPEAQRARAYAAPLLEWLRDAKVVAPEAHEIQ